MIQLACTHCGHRFELEKKEGALCPSCGWSSSVILATDVKKQVQTPSKKTSSFSLSWLPGFLIFALKVLLGAGLFFMVVWWGLKFLKPALSEKSPNKKQSQVIKVSELKPTNTGSVAPAKLTADEETALNSKISISAEVQLDDNDQKLLQRAIDLTAGNVEKLPSGSWSLQQFKQFVEQQEKVFHMPLPRSYKKSLDDLFAKTYATAYDLFLAGKIQQARDAYVSSLGFPIYNNDVRKHRAVVLTMMRSFVNDTIAKIGSMNFALARQVSSGVAEQVGSAYEVLQQQIRASQWSESLNSIEKIETLLPAPDAMSPTLQAPTYVAGFEKIDGDVQAALLKLLQVPAWTFDLNEFKSDLDVKKSLLLKLTDSERKNSVESYHRALEKIQTKNWSEAVALLREIKQPDELKSDADQKISLIEKLIGGLPAMAS